MTALPRSPRSERVGRRVPRWAASALALGLVGSLGYAAPAAASPAASTSLTGFAADQSPRPQATPLSPAEGASLAALGPEDSMNYAIIFTAGDTAQATAIRAAVTAHSGFNLTTYPDIGVTFAQFKGPTGGDWLAQQGGVSAWGPTRQQALPEREIVRADAQPVANDSSASPNSTDSTDSTEPSAAATTQSDRAKAGHLTRASVGPDQWGNDIIGVADAHQITEGAASVTVGIMDTGVDTTNPALADRIDVERSVGCTTNGVTDQTPSAWGPQGTDGVHGTHVAGIVAANPSEGGSDGVVGVAPETTLVSIATGNEDGLFYPEYVVCGFEWAMNHEVNVLNHSYYVDPWLYWCPSDPTQTAGKIAVERAVEASLKANIVSIAAAGNATEDLAAKRPDSTSPNDNQAPVPNRPIAPECLDLPTEVPGVVSVSALAESDADSDPHLASFSNYGAGKITVGAPGESIISTGFGDTTLSLSGTSMASPFVAGVAALMLAEAPDLTPTEVTDLLKQSATAVGSGDAEASFGSGIVNAVDAVNLAREKAGKPAVTPTTPASETPSETPSTADSERPTEASSSPEPTAEPSAAASAPSAFPTGIVVGGGVLVLAVIAGAVLLGRRLLRRG
ncbi:S8 family serine peptidase [Micrococcales bacterium 31B]|nr:S8 family serine peptidase [Micrococcales bacterium 31B]